MNMTQTYYVIQATRDFGFYRKGNYLWLYKTLNEIRPYSTPFLGGAEFFENEIDADKYLMHGLELKRVTMQVDELLSNKTPTQKMEDAS